MTGFIRCFQLAGSSLKKKKKNVCDDYVFRSDLCMFSP